MEGSVKEANQRAVIAGMSSSVIGSICKGLRSPIVIHC